MGAKKVVDEQVEAGRQAQIDALHAKLTEQVAAIVTGEDWVRAITFAARFRARSFNNTLLIWIQHAEAFAEGRVDASAPTYVAGYKQWASMGRQVQRGQKGYAILAPVTYRYAADGPGAPPITWRRLGRGEPLRPGEVVKNKLVNTRRTHVWDVSQTEGDPLPTPPTPELLVGDAPAGLWDGLAAQIVKRGFAMCQVPNAAAIGGANGLTNYIDNTVTVRSDMDEAARSKTLAHELAHVMLHGPSSDEARMHRGVVEVEAESIALMVGAAHGMDTTGYTIPYVSTWASDVPGTNPVEVVIDTAARVRSTSLEILAALDTQQVPDGDPPGLDRDSLAKNRTANQTAGRTRAVESLASLEVAR